MGIEDTTAEPIQTDFDFEAAGSEISENLFGETTPPETSDTDVKLDSTTENTSEEPPAPAAPEEPPAPAEPAVPAPRTWRTEAAAKWATLPPEVQKEVLKREDDIFKGLESYKADAQVGKTVNSIIAPYAPMLQQMGISPMQQIDGLMRAHYTLATGTPEQKQIAFQKLAAEYRVDLNAEAPFVDPQVQGLQKQLADLQSQFMGRQRQEAEVTRTSIQREIDTFATDPAHPHFDTLANDIAGLIKAGAAKDLAEAYEKAVWLNPVTRAAEQSRISAETSAKAKADAEAKLQATRKALGANVKSKAKAAGAAAPLGSIDDTLNASLAAIRTRA